MKINYRQIPAKLTARKDFDGNSMRGERNPDGSYVVFSYRTVIATVSVTGEVWMTDQKFSPTTSRHQNLCRAWL